MNNLQFIISLEDNININIKIETNYVICYDKLCQ
jgi:hypothetical protein